MFRCVRKVKPDAIIHLGDYFDDAQTLQEEFPHIRLYQVPGNCDRFHVPPSAQEILIMPVFGVELYMTHGHRHNVKMFTGSLLADARKARAAAALYGHTHIADCRQEEDGLWVLNPGSAGSYSGSAGIMEIQDGKIINCRIITAADLEEMV
jgi:putative phosphoesterase